MNAKEFLKLVSNDDADLLQWLLDVLNQHHVAYCIIGGLAVNAYAAPVVSLDLDLVVVTDELDALRDEAVRTGMRVEMFSHSINLSSARSDLRIQLQTDIRYQAFVPRAIERKVLGYTMMVAAIEDVLQGKVWAYLDETRRPSKRQKDLADILRLVEERPKLRSQLPPSIGGVGS